MKRTKGNEMGNTHRLRSMAAILTAAIALTAIALALSSGSATARSLTGDSVATGGGPLAATAPSVYACQEKLAQGCVSLIADASGKYCLSSFGSRSGAVRAWPCNPNSANQQWYILFSGDFGEGEEIWNQGDSCPGNAATALFDGDQCGEPSGMAASHAVNYQNYGYCISVKGGQAKQNAELVMAQCSNGQGDSIGNTSFLKPLSFEATGYGPNMTAFITSNLSHAGSPVWFISTRGQARPDAPYVLQAATKSNEKDLEFYGGNMGAAANIGDGRSGTPSPFAPGEGDGD